MKPWYQSKTLIFNGFVAFMVTLDANTGVLQPFLPTDFYTVLCIVVTAINAVFRVLTKHGISA